MNGKILGELEKKVNELKHIFFKTFKGHGYHEPGLYGDQIERLKKWRWSVC
jgi:hypothetical protein